MPPEGHKAAPGDVYEAATRCHLGLAIRTLPRGVQQRLIDHLDGIVLPEKPKHRALFLNEIAGLSARALEPGRLTTERCVGLMTRPGYLDSMVREDLTAIEDAFLWIRDIAVVCMRSSKPADYARLLSRPGVDCRRFVSTMPFFAGDRRVRFTRLEMRRRRHALEMERTARANTRESARSLLSLIVDALPRVPQGTPQTESDWKILHAFDVAAVMMRNTGALAQVLRSDHRLLIYDKAFFQLEEMLDRIVAAKQSEALVKHTQAFLIGCGIYRTFGGLMLRFGKMFKVEPIEGYVVLQPESLRRFGYVAMTTSDIDDATALLASEDERTVQHELQHVFDKISFVGVRRRVIGKHEHLLWMETRARLAEMTFCSELEAVEDSLREARENADMADSDREEMQIRIEADRFVTAKFGHVRKAEAIQKTAKRLLDQAYRQAYGLTYTQIIEPFLPQSDGLTGERAEGLTG